MKLCKDCKHYYKRPFYKWMVVIDLHNCMNPEIVNPATAEPESAEYARDNLFGKCGQEAKYFEPREENAKR